MNSTAAEVLDARGGFSLDSTDPGAGSRGFDVFRHGWQTQVGDGFPLPTFSAVTIGDFRVRSRVAKVIDAAITDLDSASDIRTGGTPLGYDDQVRIYVVRRGTWMLSGSPHRAEYTVTAGQFLLRHGPPLHFGAAPDTTVQILTLPSAMLEPRLRNRSITESATSAEMRLLAAHTNMIHTTVADLGPVGVYAAHGALIELAKAVVAGRFDDGEPGLGPALVQAAKVLADRHLADPDLGPAMLSRELHVSARTLQRAFTAAGESVTTYIRNRRLEHARQDLITSRRRPTVSEIAAHWQFSDSSHFIRAFKKRYGQTPVEFARSNDPGRVRGADSVPRLPRGHSQPKTSSTSQDEEDPATA
ncbi:helix-turn-helix domain-containing protein [Nocardia pseudobrasiliensis]|uniref:AraC-like DNA-binding protein n=1 Tax=Nocardia pseudobrasiliensis TaxID=45979 RepID=A0A370IC73_9NOCA|nr:helix-turn-helix domain-containing protein [Nocardia pseudobrasiliensis]RDI68338.1 AraC-like DNA-binding protein [Nocardia pseudobrasiliensis]